MHLKHAVKEKVLETLESEGNDMCYPLGGALSTLCMTDTLFFFVCNAVDHWTTIRTTK